MRTINRLFMASVALACLGAAQANAAGPADPLPYPGGSWIDVIGGGATFPSVAYRELLDCNFHPLGFGNVTGPGPMSSATGPNIPATKWINARCPSPNFGAAANANLNYYYAPTGSGNGKLAFKNNNNNSLTSPITTTIPYTSSKIPNYPYPAVSGFHFAGSDDVWNLQDQKDWNTLGNTAKYGNPIQLPALAGAVTIILNGKDGAGAALNQNGSVVSGSTSRINLTRQAVCGIFSGHITKWNNAILTAQNGGAAMGTGQITVVHRFDGSGTTFLLTNALNDQCRSITGPNSEIDPTIVSYAFPWGDNSTPCPAVLRGANRVDWPDQFSGHCGVTAPAGSVFTNSGTNGSQSLVTTTLATNGAIGYVSPDFAKPAAPTGPITANLQNEWDISTNITATPVFVAPTVVATAEAMQSITPVFDATTIANPLAWSLQGVVSNPTRPAAYPIAGFTWLDIYTCYNSPNNISEQVKGFLYTLYAGGVYEGIINDNGFAMVPNVWLGNVYTLLGDINLAPGNVSGAGANPTCAGKVGAT
jgi:phosphate transport system substrate-binding protein